MSDALFVIVCLAVLVLLSHKLADATDNAEVTSGHAIYIKDVEYRCKAVAP